MNKGPNIPLRSQRNTAFFQKKHQPQNFQHAGHRHAKSNTMSRSRSKRRKHKGGNNHHKIQNNRRSGRCSKFIERIKNSGLKRYNRDKEQERKRNTRKLRRHLNFFRIRTKPRSQEQNQLRHKKFHQQSKDKQKERQHRNGLRSKMHSFLLSVRDHFSREHRNKSRCKSTLGKQATKKIREFKRHKKGISHFTGAQKVSQNHIAEETGHTTKQCKAAKSRHRLKK